MTRFITTAGAKAGLYDIGISIDTQSELNPQWLLKYFDEQIEEGRQFNSEETVQIGWMIVQLRLAQDGILEVWEPEFDSIPIRWRRGANNTIRHLILQRSVCDALGCEPEFPSLRQAGIVSPGFRECEEFTMSRDASNANDSGWVFRELGYVGTDGDFESLFQISFFNMEVIPFLALPRGYLVIKRLDNIKICSENVSVSSLESELLQRLLKCPVLV